jgi:hypothetical protein
VCYFVWFILRSCLDLLHLRSGLDNTIGGLRRCEGHAAILSHLLEQVRQGTTICRLVPALLGAIDATRLLAPSRSWSAFAQSWRR